MAHLGGQHRVAEHQRRVGQPHRDLGQILHLDQHVDRPIEVGEGGGVGFLGHGRVPERGAGQLAHPGDANRRAVEEEHVTGKYGQVTVDVVGDPVPAAANRRDSHPGDGGEFERRQRPVRHVAALAHQHPMGHLFGVGQVRHQLAGMPRRWVTMRAMSTASLAMRWIAEITWRTETIASASFGFRAAITHTVRMSWTSSDMRSSSSSTSSAMSGSPK